MKTLTRRLSHSASLLLILSLCAVGQQAQEATQARVMPHDDVVTSVAFSPDGRTLASGSLDGSIIFWDSATAEVFRRLEHVSTYVYAVVFSPDGKSLAAGCYGGAVKIFDAASGREQRTLYASADVEALAFSPDGRMLASGDDSATVTLWDTADGRELRKLNARMPVTSLAINPASTALAAASSEAVVRLWEIKTGRLLRELKDCTQCYYHSVAFSPDGKTLVSGGKAYGPTSPSPQELKGSAFSAHSSIVPLKLPSEISYNVTLWDVKTGQLRHVLKGHTDSILSLAFNPKSGLLASGGYDRRIMLWNAQSGALVQTVTGLNGSVQEIAFSPDGKLLASTNGSLLEEQRSIVILDAATGVTRLMLKGESRPSWAGRIDRDLMGSKGSGKSPGGGVGEGTSVGPGRGGNTGGGDGGGIGTGIKPPAPSPAPSPTTDYNRTFNPKEVTTKARLLSKPEPQYTEKARINGVTGTVIVRAVLGSDGTVKGIRVVSSLPYGLTSSAVRAASKIKFMPAVKDGHQVSQYIQIEYNFNLY